MSVYASYEKYIREGLRAFAANTTEFRVGLLNHLLARDSETIDKRLERARKHYEELEEALRSIHMPYLRFDAAAEEPLLVGSSGGLGYLVFEVGLSWDPIYDLPVIPGSGVKGVARSFVEEHYGRELAERIFGCTGKGEEKGAVASLIFFDSYPVEAPGGVLEKDIVNPHYNPLTKLGLRSELDVEPVPVPHLVVRKGTVFRFFVAGNPRFNAGRLARAASRLRAGDTGALMAYLLGAVMRLGVGSRTLKGYGRLKLVGEVVYYDGAR